MASELKDARAKSQVALFTWVFGAQAVSYLCVFALPASGNVKVRENGQYLLHISAAKMPAFSWPHALACRMSMLDAQRATRPRIQLCHAHRPSRLVQASLGGRGWSLSQMPDSERAEQW